ncbi:hypothetical protein SCACP_08310 [Sporomusa carbonis]
MNSNANSVLATQVMASLLRLRRSFAVSRDATVFSQTRRIVFEKSLTTPEVERRLRDFIRSVGKALSHNEIILGHIKVLAKLPEPAAEHFLVLSLTRLDRVDVTPSDCWRNRDGVILDSLELYVNVLVFEHTLSAVKKVVNDALKDLGGSVSRMPGRSSQKRGVVNIL